MPNRTRTIRIRVSDDGIDLADEFTQENDDLFMTIARKGVFNNLAVSGLYDAWIQGTGCTAEAVVQKVY